MAYFWALLAICHRLCASVVLDLASGFSSQAARITCGPLGCTFYGPLTNARASKAPVTQ